MPPPIRVPPMAPSGFPNAKTEYATVRPGSSGKVTATIPKPEGDTRASPRPAKALITQRATRFYCQLQCKRLSYPDEWRHHRAEDVERQSSNEQSSTTVDIRQSSRHQQRTDSAVLGHDLHLPAVCHAVSRCDPLRLEIGYLEVGSDTGNRHDDRSE